MSSKKPKDAEEQTPDVEEVTVEDAAGEETPDPAQAALAAALADVARLEKEADDAKDKYLRMLAEYDNYRKRTAKERETTYTDAVADTIADLLPVVDNLARAAAYEDASKIAEGLALTVKQADGVLAKWKIEPTAAVGQAFDPNYHNAVMHVEDEEQGDGVIVEVFQQGYRRGDRVIREAVVKVAN